MGLISQRGDVKPSHARKEIVLIASHTIKKGRETTGKAPAKHSSRGGRCKLSVKRAIIDVLRSEPLKLNWRSAERCAKEIYRVIERNRKTGRKIDLRP